ncbi:MAG: hypothetical protein IJZ21_04680, partial [Clostridia bacterium]|nr:hypothetical protein [Clostridia bacterium]
MKSLVLFLSKIRYLLLLISAGISFWSYISILLYDFSVELLAYILPWCLLIGFGRVGILGLSRIKLLENPLFIDFNTILFAGIGTLTSILLFFVSIINFYDKKLLLLTAIVGCLAIGGTSRLYEIEKYNIRKVGKKFDKF